MTPLAAPTNRNRRYLLIAAVLAVALYVFLPQLGEFRSSRHLLWHPADPWWLTAAVLFTALTYAAGSATYCLLAFKPLRYGQELLVQLAAMFINRLLPAGIGGAGVNYAYLRKARHQVAQAASVVAVNNLLGLMGHGLLVGITLAVFAGDPTIASGTHRLTGSAELLIAGAIAVTAVIVVLLRRGRLRRLAKETGRQLFSYRRRPLSLGLALLSSMSLSLCNILSLYCCARALAVHLSLVALMLIFTFGVGVGTVTPTPGGLGGFEAGLVTGLAAYHVAGPLALATALLYRLVSYWLPLLAGGPAFVACQRRQLFRLR
jgi:uncharacterized membrane protein YbhN (UPF0104 family)